MDDALSNSLARHSFRVLLVEDHQDTLTVLVRVLVRFGYNVTPAASFGEALRLASQSVFHLLVTDLELGDGNGWALYQRLREMNPSIVGLAVSGHAMPYDLR